MGQRTRHAGLVGAACAFLLCQGCAYYEVSDPSSGRKYYTDNWSAKRSGPVGTVVFKDNKSGKTVTLQSSEVREISEAEYRQALVGP